MKLFSREQINKTRKDQTRELAVKNERLAKSLREMIKLQNDFDFDVDKAKKVKEYQVWCEDLQKKMSIELGNLKAYEKLIEEKKDEYYNLVARKDELEDKILDKKEELSKLDLQITLKNQILTQQNARVLR